MQKDDNIIIVCGSFRTRGYPKRWFPKDGVRRVEGKHCRSRLDDTLSAISSGSKVFVNSDIVVFKYSKSV